MDQQILKLLFDIQNAITEIESYFPNRLKNFNVYQSNIQLKRAVERDLEIIGEAVSRIMKLNPDFPINNAKKGIQITYKEFYDILNGVVKDMNPNR